MTGIDKIEVFKITLKLPVLGNRKPYDIPRSIYVSRVCQSHNAAIYHSPSQCLACKDYQGRSFPAGSAFLLEKVGSYCKQCTCSRKNGVLFAECFKFYCESLTCPPSYQEPRPNTCCKRCRSDWSKCYI